MSNDTAQQNLSEPLQLDWDSAFKSGSYEPPPPAQGPDGKYITYYAKVVEIKPSNPEIGSDGKAYLNYQIDMKLVNSGSFDGRELRTWASTKTFARKDADGNLVPMKGNPNALAKFLRSAGLTARPQSNSEYQAAIKLVNGKALPITLDWEAKNRDTGEVVRGFNNFPDDPDRPGQRKSILKTGDVVTERDHKGQITGTRSVTSEVLFANPRLKYFLDPTPKVAR